MPVRPPPAALVVLLVLPVFLLLSAASCTEAKLEAVARGDDQALFYTLDADRDGLLAGPELGPDGLRLAYDADGDGVVSRDEFVLGRGVDRRHSRPYRDGSPPDTSHD